MQSIIESGIAKPTFSVKVSKCSTFNVWFLFGSSIDVHQAGKGVLQRNQDLDRAKIAK